jgi:hypothetical protein
VKLEVPHDVVALRCQFCIVTHRWSLCTGECRKEHKSFNEAQWAHGITSGTRL